MRMRMITDDAMKVHFGLRLLDRAAAHAYCHNYSGVKSETFDTALEQTQSVSAFLWHVSLNE